MKKLYKIISERTRFKLEETITTLINDGCELVGGVSHDGDGYMQAITEKVSSSVYYDEDDELEEYFDDIPF